MSTKKETERSKLVQEKCQNLITVMLKDEDNKYCVDCDAKGPRWASWNLGVFLCIRCAGIHRNLGVHITRVKSVNLDTWLPEQVASLQHMGNSRARAVYEAQLPDGFRRPQTDAALESFIRAKYEQKKYVAKEWVPSPVPKVDWEKEIDEELEKQKRKKKSLAAAGGGSAILGGSLASPNVEKKPAVSKPTPIPAPLPKPKSSGHSPKTGRPQLELSNASAVLSSPTAPSNGHSNTLDLLGLSSPPPNTATGPGAAATNPAKESSNGATSDDEFNNFFSANSQSRSSQPATAEKPTEPRSLADEEADFFNQSVPSDAEKAKLTKDSIMALYGSQAQAMPQPVVVPGVAATSNVNLLAGLGFPGVPQSNGGFPTQPQQAPQVNGLNNHFGGHLNLGMPPQQPLQQAQAAGATMFGAQFAGVPQQQPQMHSQFMNGGGGGFYQNGNGGMMGQPQQHPVTAQNMQQGMNFFPVTATTTTTNNGGFHPQQQQQQMINPMLMQGKGGFQMGVNQPPQPQQQFPFGGVFGGQQPQGQMGQQQQQQQQGMQKQFGNLNLGNVWQ